MALIEQESMAAQKAALPEAQPFVFDKRNL